MKPGFIISMFLVAGLATSCSNPDSNTRTGEKDWSELFLTDLAAAKQIISDNHPGAIDTQNPAFNDWLETGYEQAKLLAPKIKTGRDYRYGLAAYDAGFRDGHLIIAPDMQNGQRVGFENEREIRRWPGFLTGWREGRHIIEHTSPVLDYLKGGIVRACDGKPATQITHEKVFDFGRNPDLPAHWVNAVKFTFTDSGTSLISLPEYCEIELPDNSLKNHKLIWRDYDTGELNEPLGNIGFYSSDPAGSEWIGDDVLWVTLPHFQPQGKLVDVYKDMQNEIATNRARIGTLVFDLRGNGGGSSFWGDGFAQNLWGRESADALKNAGASSYVEWRVTPHNIDKLRTWIADEIENNGADTEGAKWAQNVIDGMSGAMKRGDEMWREAEPGKSTPLSAEIRQNIKDGPRVFALTDGYCSSACLDFMDDLMIAPSVTHIGYETSADTQYMDITAKKLPSGLMSVIYPVKVYRGRQRPDGGYYTPTHRYEGPWTSEAVRAWTLRIIAEENQDP